MDVSEADRLLRIARHHEWRIMPGYTFPARKRGRGALVLSASGESVAYVLRARSLKDALRSTVLVAPTVKWMSSYRFEGDGYGEREDSDKVMAILRPGVESWWRKHKPVDVTASPMENKYWWGDHDGSRRSDRPWYGQVATDELEVPLYEATYGGSLLGAVGGEPWLRAGANLYAASDTGCVTLRRAWRLRGDPAIGWGTPDHRDELVRCGCARRDRYDKNGWVDLTYGQKQ